ncbi:MAG: hypothetical protein ABI700_16145, partial [Chloroflexota bacterium]
NSAAEFAGGFYTPNPAQGNVIVFVGALSASYILQTYNVAADSPEAVLNGIFDSMPSFDRPQTSAIRSLVVNGHPAARADAHYEKTEGTAMIVQYSDDQFGLLSFVTPPGEISRWEATALAIFETVNIAGSAPCLPAFDKILTSAQDATPEATETLVQDDYPALDAAYCLDGLRFDYPSGWYLSQSEPTNPNAQNLISAWVSTDKDGISVYQNRGIAVLIDVYKAPELLELFRDQSTDEGGGYKFLSGLLKYFSDTLAGANLEALIIPGGDHKVFRLRLYTSLEDRTYTLLDSGIMIQFTYTLSAPFENPDPLDVTAMAIFDTITFDPDTPCLSNG